MAKKPTQPYEAKYKLLLAVMKQTDDGKKIPPRPEG